MKRFYIIVLFMIFACGSVFATEKKGRGFAGVSAQFSLDNTSESESGTNQSSSSFSLSIGGGYYQSENFSLSASLEFANVNNIQGFAFVPTFSGHYKINKNLFYSPSFNIGLGDLSGVFFIYPFVSLFAFESYFNDNFAISFAGPTAGVKYLMSNGHSAMQISFSLSVSSFSLKYIF